MKSFPPIWFSSGIFAGVFLDQLTKIWGKTLTNPIEILPFFRFVFVKNTGIAFSLPVPQSLVLVLTLGFLISIFIWVKPWNQRRPEAIAWGFFLSGAIGNFIDRLRLGYVIDFISVHTFPVINIADIFISLGVVGLLLSEYKKSESE